MSDQVVIICAPYSRAQLRALPGNRAATCEDCAEAVVISAQGLRLLSVQPAARLLCLTCARREAPDSPTLAVPGAIEAALAFGVPPTMSARVVGRPLRDVLDEDGNWR